MIIVIGQLCRVQILALERSSKENNRNQWRTGVVRVPPSTHDKKKEHE
jgi:hypothetical protein